MKKLVHAVSLLLQGMILFTLISCALSDTPAKGGSADIHVAFAGPKSARNGDRAVFGASGYLYARTIGGPPDEVRPAYGPFPVVAGVAELTGFLPGEYSTILILHTPTTLEGETLTFDGVSRPFEEVVALPDEEYLATVMDASPDEGFDLLIDGYGSEGETGPVTLVTGANSVSLVLVPLCSTNSRVTLVRSGERFSGSFGTAANRFIRLELDSNPSEWSSILFMVPQDTLNPSFTLWNNAGAPIANFAFDEDFRAYTSLRQANEFPLYLFVGSTSQEEIAFSAVDGSIAHVEPRLQSLTVNGLAVSPTFAPDVFSYSILLDSSTVSAEIEAVAVSPAQTVSFNPSSTISPLAYAVTRGVQITVLDALLGSVSYDLTVTRQGIPEIGVYWNAAGHGTGELMDISYYNPAPAFTKDITIENSGSAPLNVTCSISSATPSLFTLSASNAVILPGSSTVLALMYTDTVPLTTRTGTLLISSDDADESSFIVSLSGRQEVPEIAVSWDAAVHGTGESMDISYYSVSFTKDITIENSGSAPLTITCSISSTTPSLFSLVPSEAVIPPGSTAELLFTYSDSESMITRTATLLISSDDADESPFILNLSGWYC